jgi:pimeloyl-ACP methyl ester carboxylesterase
MISPRRYMDKDFLTKNFETLYGDASNAVGEFSINMIPPSLKGYLHQLMAMAGWTSLPFIRRIPARTLVLAGDNDHIVPVINAHFLNVMLKHSRLHIFEGAGHLFALTRREEMVGILREFFGEPEVPMPVVEPVQLPSVTASYHHF